ncbi:hypothetical protein OSB94_15445 [Proteus vulgaris]|uniref:hypothetical protein n=1 Tax=Proteus mirabilis TaxID=584 RepID=UPI0024DF6739|nr:hypothetical protein [Providencia rettgeri]MDS0789491.1 hypothetical protein [Proteus vulgaris]
MSCRTFSLLSQALQHRDSSSVLSVRPAPSSFQSRAETPVLTTLAACGLATPDNCSSAPSWLKPRAMCRVRKPRVT